MAHDGRWPVVLLLYIIIHLSLSWVQWCQNRKWQVLTTSAACWLEGPARDTRKCVSYLKRGCIQHCQYFVREGEESMPHPSTIIHCNCNCWCSLTEDVPANGTKKSCCGVAMQSHGAHMAMITDEITFRSWEALFLFPLALHKATHFTGMPFKQ